MGHNRAADHEEVHSPVPWAAHEEAHAVVHEADRAAVHVAELDPAWDVASVAGVADRRPVGRRRDSREERAVLEVVPAEGRAASPSVQVAHGDLDPACVLGDPVVESLDAWVVCSIQAVGRLVHACLGADPDLGDHAVGLGLGDLETVDTTACINYNFVQLLYSLYLFNVESGFNLLKLLVSCMNSADIHTAQY